MQNIAYSWAFDGHRFRGPGVMQVHSGRILSLQDSGTDQGDGLVLLPGFVNLHAHLELTDLVDRLPRNVAFPDWVARLRQCTGEWNHEDYARSFANGVLQLLSTGTTTVLDIGNSGIGWDRAGSSPLRIIALLELLGLDRNTALNRLNTARERLAALPALTGAGFRGITPHALYSCHEELLACIARTDAPCSIHIAESREEAELYTTAQGEFRNWIDGFEPNHRFQRPLGPPLLQALELGISAQGIWVHGNTLSPLELATISGAGGYLVHCPQSARWFGHPKLDLLACMDMGVSLCIGTDSLASAESLDLWDQLRLVHLGTPTLSAQKLLAMATSVPGQALQSIDRIGQLAEGFSADWVTLQAPPGFAGDDWNWLFREPIRIKQISAQGIHV